MNVYLAGMIGAGKTVLGERLAARLGWPFRDLDREIDRALGRSFHELVREAGWLAFRELEYGVVKQFAAARGMVCALGGGTVRYEWNRDVLRRSGVTVLLEADLVTLTERVRTADRPRVNPGVSREEDVARIWASSAHLYREAADLVYRTDTGLDLDAEAGELERLLQGHLRSEPDPSASRAGP